MCLYQFPFCEKVLQVFQKNLSLKKKLGHSYVVVYVHILYKKCVLKDIIIIIL